MRVVQIGGPQGTRALQRAFAFIRVIRGRDAWVVRADLESSVVMRHACFMKNSFIEPYLFFGGRCDEAIEFYRAALGAQVEMLMRFSESPQPMPPGLIPAGFEKKVMHASLRIGESRVMVSDGNAEGAKFEGFSLSLALPTEAAVEQAFAALAAGGKVGMPLAKTFWSPKFGMVTDRFGIGWMVSVAAQNS